MSIEVRQWARWSSDDGLASVRVTIDRHTMDGRLVFRWAIRHEWTTIATASDLMSGVGVDSSGTDEQILTDALESLASFMTAWQEALIHGPHSENYHLFDPQDQTLIDWVDKYADEFYANTHMEGWMNDE